MREILFKAKRIDNGEWVEGSLLQTTAVSLKSFIVESSCYTFDKWDWNECVQVDTDTICQYTGLTDKNGCRIWENDCIGHRLNVVEFLNGEWCVNGDRPLFFMAEDCEVIGTAFDNPELMKGE